MTNTTNLTKAELKAELDGVSIAYAPKANHATLSALYFSAIEDGLIDAPAAPDAVVPEAPAEPEVVAPPAPPAAAAPTGTGLKIEKDREEKNGIKRPSIGGKCRAIWDALDAHAESTGDDPTAKDVKALAAEQGWNPNNASIEFYQWRKFHGITKPKA